MRFAVSIDLGNAAFEGDASEEIARILRDTADIAGRHVIDPEKRLAAHPIRDINGNVVGEWAVVP